MNQEILKFIKTRIEEDLARFREGNPILVINKDAIKLLEKLYNLIKKTEVNYSAQKH